MSNFLKRYREIYPYMGTCLGMSLLYYCIFQTHLPGISINYFIQNFQSFSFDWQIILISTIPCYFLGLTIAVGCGGWYLGQIFSEKAAE